jgi:hypothetical protein
LREQSLLCHLGF